MRSSNKEINKVVDTALKNGFHLVRQRKHLILKRGNQTLSVSVSPSCPYAARNAMGQLARMLKDQP